MHRCSKRRRDASLISVGESRLRVYDDIHGLVFLAPAEEQIVDSPYFQRLRRIRQLGLAHMVFPGADHTRFSHSIGVLAVAAKVCGKLKADLSPREQDMIRMAALLHDIGHFPLSHTLESAYAAFNKTEATQKRARDVELKPPQGRRNPHLPPDGASRVTVEPALHEEFGKWVVENTDVPGGITRILAENSFNPEEIAGIAAPIAGAHDDTLINQLLRSDLDVDKMDYLLRDARNTGVGYGEYDIEYLIDNMKVVTIDGRRLLCVDQPALHTTEHYLLAKHFYWIQLLFQKTRFIIEELASCICRRLLEAGFPRLPDYQTLKTWAKKPHKFMMFDDDYITAVMRVAEASRKVHEDTKALIRMLRYRELPGLLLEWQASVKKANRTEVGRLKQGFSEACDSVRCVGDAHAVLKRCGLDRFPDAHVGHARTLREYGEEADISLRRVLIDHPDPIRIALRSKDAFSPTQVRRSDDGTRWVTIIEQLRGSLMSDLARRDLRILRMYGGRSTGAGVDADA